MPRFPYLQDTSEYLTETNSFLGLDRRLKAPDGTFSAMKNLTGEEYPVMATRKLRGNYASLNAPQGIIAKDTLAWVDAGSLYYNGSQVAGVTLSSGEKQLVSMGAYLVIFPDKYYLNTADFSDHGYIEVRRTVEGSVSFAMCDIDGNPYEAVASFEPPEAPTNGMAWVDTAGSTHSLKVYSEESVSWVTIPSTYVRIYATGIGSGLNDQDGIALSGASAPDSAFSAQIEALNGQIIAHRASDDYIVVTGFLDEAVNVSGASIKVERTVPDMDFVVESGNRLWGCYYGLKDGTTVNELYCCALGDFRNWNRFLGISTDSWAASQGSDGEFTGAITHLGYPLFFKENCLHKIYPSTTGAHQVTTTVCRGVQKGSHKSLVVVDEYLYYKSRTDICVYDGSLPASVSEALGNERYYEAAAGAYDGRYHISMRDPEGYWHMMAYDTNAGLWHEEDDFHAFQFAQMEDDLYAIDADTGDLWALYGTQGVPEHDLEWMATTSIIGFEYPEQKRLSRWNIRLDLPEGSELDVYVQYNSDGIWNHVRHKSGGGLGAELIPVVARRCDHLQIKLEGKGAVRLYSFAKQLALSGDRWYR